MSVDLAPRRFVLSAQELSSAFVAAGLGVPGAPLFKGLPMARHELPEPVAGPNGELDAHAALCLAVLSDPLASVTLRHWPAGSVHAVETLVVAGGDGPVYIQLACEGDRWDVMHLGSREEGLAALERLVGPSPGPDARRVEPVSLSLAALAVLGILADFLREARLLAIYFAGQPQRRGLALELTPERILEALHDQSERANLNSGFARLVLASEGALAELADSAAVKAGFAELRDKGLLDTAFRPSETASALLDHLAYGRSLTILQAARRTEAGLMADTLVLHDGRAGRLAGGWLTDAEGCLQAMRLTSCDQAACRILVEELLGR